MMIFVFALINQYVCIQFAGFGAISSVCLMEALVIVY